MDHYFTNNENLKSEIKNLNYSYNGNEYSFLSDNGVFSKNKIDFGSSLLLETFLKNNTSYKSVLDVGCGYGFLGIMVALNSSCDMTMVDVNKRALHLAKRNADNFNVKVNIIESNTYEKVEGKFDIIITNPPVRAGKKVLLDILINAKEHLNDGGSLWYVLRKDQGAKSVQKELEKYYEVKNIAKSKGFYIFSCKKC